MTNAEKFEEVFGIKIDEDYPSGICQSIDHKICEELNCPDCPAFKFWDKEYEEKARNNMATRVIIPELNLKNIIAESREVAQALNGFADNLERIEEKYADPQEESDESYNNNN